VGGSEPVPSDAGPRLRLDIHLFAAKPKRTAATASAAARQSSLIRHCGPPFRFRTNLSRVEPAYYVNRVYVNAVDVIASHPEHSMVWKRDFQI
jgi:hypothetical protein